MSDSKTRLGRAHGTNLLKSRFIPGERQVFPLRALEGRNASAGRLARQKV